jgi:hypothetical protein
MPGSRPANGSKANRHAGNVACGTSFNPPEVPALQHSLLEDV